MTISQLDRDNAAIAATIDVTIAATSDATFKVSEFAYDLPAEQFKTADARDSEINESLRMAKYSRQVTNAGYSLAVPTQTNAPTLVHVASDLGEKLGFDETFMQSTEFTQLFSGNALAKGMRPFAMCYGGHQFGQWAGQLGDGRAINLGAIENHQGDVYELQLKGAGPTPYSRNADGRARMWSQVVSIQIALIPTEHHTI